MSCQAPNGTWVPASQCGYPHVQSLFDSLGFLAIMVVFGVFVIVLLYLVHEHEKQSRR